MLTVLERVREALADRYDVLRESGSGGMGVVFVARDPGLDRKVAIKVLRPELATAAAAERFLAEARILARLNHPNVVTVHDVGEADGLFYYVMEYLEVPTLAVRLTEGPLAAAAALKLGRDLLDGLEAAHVAGIVHCDVKPGNIFLAADRALVSDFGIATAANAQARGQVRTRAGTPAYMAPEQGTAAEVTFRTDLYAAGMVIYEAYRGRRWSLPASPDRADWSGVPRSVVPVLRRALAPDPDDRWPDAASFRRALWKTRTRPYVRRTVVLTATALAIGLATGDIFDRFDPPRTLLEPSDLAILPFEVAAGVDGTLGEDLAHLVVLNLKTFPQPTLAEERHVFRWWRDATDQSMVRPEAAARSLRARNVVSGAVLGTGDSVEVRLTLTDSAGRPIPGQYVARGSASDPVALGDAVTRQVLTAFAPDLLPGYAGAFSPGTLDLGAFREFMHGETAFRANDWRRAIRHYSEAAALDPNLALALWRSWNAWGWLFQEEPRERPDLEQLYRQHADQLNELERRLVEAQLTPAGPQRFDRYEEARTYSPNDAYTALLYGNELVSRGALFGIETSEAIAQLEDATARDSLLSPAHALLALTHIRLGQREAARLELDRLHGSAAPPPPAEPDVPALLELAFVERFVPERTGVMRSQAFPEGAAGSLEQLEFAVRWPLYFELSKTQVDLGRTLTERAGPTRPALRASGHTAQALGLLAAGRARDALVHVDSAAAIGARPEDRLVAAEWRVLLALLQIPEAPGRAELDGARQALEQLSSVPEAAVRAAWALALDAGLHGDTASVAAWHEALRAISGDSATGRLDRTLQAMRAASLDPGSAIRITDGLNSEYVLRRNEDPFARAVLHILRAQWWLDLGEPQRAEQEWLWTENFDVIAYPSGMLQQSEVDWALGPWARYQRAVSALRRGATNAGCTRLERTVEQWSEANGAFGRLAQMAADSFLGACPQ
jgi:tetratricopeptide (TPR) repeat protein